MTAEERKIEATRVGPPVRQAEWAPHHGLSPVGPGHPHLPLFQLLLLVAVALNPAPNVEDRWCALRAVPGDLGPARCESATLWLAL